MLPKKNKADTRTLKRVFQSGRFVNSQLFTFKFIAEGTDVPPRISVIVPKSVGRLATERNALRRRGYAALEKHLSRLPGGIIGAFIFRKPGTGEEIERGIEPILRSLKKT